MYQSHRFSEVTFSNFDLPEMKWHWMISQKIEFPSEFQTVKYIGVPDVFWTLFDFEIKVDEEGHICGIRG